MNWREVLLSFVGLPDDATDDQLRSAAYAVSDTRQKHLSFGASAALDAPGDGDGLRSVLCELLGLRTDRDDMDLGLALQEDLRSMKTELERLRQAAKESSQLDLHGPAAEIGAARPDLVDNVIRGKFSLECAGGIVFPAPAGLRMYANNSGAMAGLAGSGSGAVPVVDEETRERRRLMGFPTDAEWERGMRLLAEHEDMQPRDDDNEAERVRKMLRIPRTKWEAVT